MIIHGYITVGKVNIVDANDNILVSLVSDADGFHFDYTGSDYKKYDLATAQIDIIVMPDVDTWIQNLC